MASTASDTATAAASTGIGIHSAQVTPTAAEISWPPVAAQGWESWPCGTANSNTADAPMEPTISQLSPTER